MEAAAGGGTGRVGAGSREPERGGPGRRRRTLPASGSGRLAGSECSRAPAPPGDGGDHSPPLLVARLQSLPRRRRRRPRPPRRAAPMPGSPRSPDRLLALLARPPARNAPPAPAAPPASARTRGPGEVRDPRPSRRSCCAPLARPESCHPKTRPGPRPRPARGCGRTDGLGRASGDSHRKADGGGRALGRGGWEQGGRGRRRERGGTEEREGPGGDAREGARGSRGAEDRGRGGAGRVGRSRPGRGERGPRGAERGELAGPARERAGWEGLWTPKADLGRLEKFGDKRSGGRGEVGGVWGNTEVEIWIMGLYWTDGEEGQEAEAGGV